MVGVVPDEGSRRRLPQWMLGVSADEQARKYDNVEENNINLQEGLVYQAGYSQKKTLTICPGKDLMLCEKDKSLKNSHCLAKCNSKRRKRKSKQQNADCDGNIPEALPEEENGFGRKVPTDRKRRKTKFSGFDSEKLEVQPSNDDDVELTVEDLMNIAEEVIFSFLNAKEKSVKNFLKFWYRALFLPFYICQTISCLNTKYTRSLLGFSCFGLFSCIISDII